MTYPLQFKTSQKGISNPTHTFSMYNSVTAKFRGIRIVAPHLECCCCLLPFWC